MRFLKQFLYGLFYLLCLGVVLGLVYLILRPSETCFDGIQNQNEAGIDCGDICGIDCELKYIQPLIVSRPLIFKSDGLVSFIAQIKNPNLSYGSDKFEYKINFYDAQNKLLNSLTRMSFIYAGETKNIIEVAVRVSDSVSKGEAVIDQETINWKPALEWQVPNLKTADIKAYIEESTLKISGTITNSSNFLISKIIISAVLKDNWGTSVGVSKTELTNLRPFQQSNFQIFSPINPSLQKLIDLEATQILVEAKK